MRAFISKYSIPVLLGVVLGFIIFSVLAIGMSLYIGVRLGSSSVTTSLPVTTDTSDTAESTDIDYIDSASKVTDSKITLDLNNKVVEFNYDKNIMGAATAQVFRYINYSDACYEDGRYGADVSFSRSDVKLNFNACGLGGISEEEVGKFTVKAKSGELFNISYTNCVKAKEVYPTEADYLKDLNTIGKTCRSYYLGSQHISDKINIHFMFETTVEQVEGVNQQIKRLVESMVIADK